MGDGYLRQILGLAHSPCSQDSHVRAEIAAALMRGLVVIPVRVGQEGRMPPLPHEHELPEDIRALALHQKHDVAHERFGRDVADLVGAVKGHLVNADEAHLVAAFEALQRGERRIERRTSRGERALLWLGVILLAGGAYLLLEAGTRDPVTLVRAEAPPSPGSGKEKWFRDCTACPEMVVVPPGNFMMGLTDDDRGSDVPQRRVTIALPFGVGRFAVTFDEWDACVAAGGCNGYRPSDAGWGRGRRPVINISWDDAKAYVAWLSRATGKRYRLPSEAEREYVTRAGTTSRYWWGSSISTDQANYNGRGSGGMFRQKTLPVDSFGPNPWGLYQVHGNVYEWTEDCWNESDKGAPADGAAWLTGPCEGRVLRGGFWRAASMGLRAVSRVEATPNMKWDYVGFRVVRNLD
jgi:formylglycine-generating enzyme required for sulfatase activity